LGCVEVVGVCTTSFLLEECNGHCLY
jgi:hypothetical protein